MKEVAKVGRMALGAISVILASWGVVWFTRALKASGRWFTVKGLLRFGPDWWQNVFIERPGHHAYFQYAIPYLVFFVLVIGGVVLFWLGCRTYRSRS